MAVIAKYKFNSTLYADLVPEFNAEFTNYVVTDETTETDSKGNVIKTRVIEHDTLLPTFMRFGILSNPGVRESALTEIISINTSNINDMTCMFYGCTNVTSINTNDWDTSKVTSMNSLFCLCTSLTSIDVSNFDTSNVTDMSYMFSMYSATSKLTTIIGLEKLNTSKVNNMKAMFYLSTSLTSLDVSNFDTRNVTTMRSMFRSCYSLTSLDVSNWDTSKVTDMGYMFSGCTKLTSLDLSNFDTSKVIDMTSMFYDCTNLTSLDVSNWDTSNVTNMNSMFCSCYSLTSLDVSNWNTSKVTDMGWMFAGYNRYMNLTSIKGLDKFNTSKVTTMEKMFYNCNNLTSLDVSNFDTTNVTTITNIFYDTPLLKDIGMLYCSQSTINTLSSNVSTPSTNVWVEGGMIDDLTSYDNVTYKAYYWEKEVLLNSPLLEGDKIVKKDGKLYHYHKMGMVVLDGSEDWYRSSDVDTEDTKRYSFSVNNLKRSGFIICDNIGTSSGYTEIFPHNITGRIDIKHYYLIDSRWSDISSLKQWLSENPTTVVYELANPYYELISDSSDDLSLSLLSEDNIISNNSLIPTNMNVKNNGMTTVAMQSSTKYTVAFDKDTDSSVTIDLCGSTIDTTDNVVEITTPSELANDEITFIGDCKVSNVRILEGSVSGDAIPKESFEGLKNSFEDGYIPESMITQSEVQFSGLSLQEDWYSTDNSTSIDYTGVKILKDYKDRFEIGKTYTFMLTVTNTYTSDITFKDGYDIRGVGVWYDVATLHAGETKTIVLAKNYNTNIEVYNVFNFGTTQSGVSYKVNKNIIVLEGDWTHLSEEDFNNLGKYKVEYKVTGKNKFDINKMILKNQNQVVVRKEKDAIYIESGTTTSKFFAIAEWNPPTNYFKENVEYKLCNHCSVGSNNVQFVLSYYDENGTKRYKTSGGSNGISYIHSNLHTNLSIYIQLDTPGYTYDNVVCKFQIEEGTVATEYEPYKEYTKTFYLNSPLLEGDTIEDVNGVATHVKRYKKVVLDGSVALHMNDDTQPSDTSLVCYSFTPYYKDGKVNGEVYADKLSVDKLYVTQHTKECIKLSSTGTLLLTIHEPSANEAVQRLQSNPIIVVYELASPIYEPISTESILCDSYVNGHLDVDSNIPIEKVMFNYVPIKNVYLTPNTNYVIQFESDNVGKLDSIVLGGYSQLHNIDVVKGLNKIKFYTTDNVGYGYIDLYGIGFNASNIQVVATDRDNIGYFKGIQSSFEDKITEDNKYEVKVTLEDENGVISNEFIYLNSPLLKGDRIEMYNGKLCHYHKMGKVVLDGSEDEGWRDIDSNDWETSTHIAYITRNITDMAINPWGSNESKIISNIKVAPPNATTMTDSEEHISFESNNGLNGNKGVVIKTTKLNALSLGDFKQWLQQNPTTVVYELAEPYYEDITPIQNEFVITSIGESSFIIDSGAIPTDGEITYSVNVKLLNDLEESINNNNTSSTDTDLSTILDDIINE